MPEISLRNAVATDAPCIAMLATQVFLDTYATEGIDLSMAQEAIEHFSTGAISTLLADASTTLVVAESAGRMIAFVQLRLGPPHALVAANGPALEVTRLYVQEGFTGKGVGSALMRCAEALALAQGASAVWLTAWVGNQRARDFYARRGFQDVGATQYVFQGVPYENRVFVRALQPGAATLDLEGSIVGA